MPGDAEQPVGPLTRPATRTFFGAPAVDDLDRLDARVAFLGVPTDQGVIIPFIRSGAFAGPRLVRETRTRLRESRPDGADSGYHELRCLACQASSCYDRHNDKSCQGAHDR